MSDDMDDDFRRADHSIGSADQANYQDDFDDWDWLEQEMQREAEENEREREAWNKEMEMQIAYSKHLANMTVKYMNSKSQEIHASKPYPSCQLDCGSFREAWLETLHEGNNPDRYLSLHQLRDRRQTTKKPLRAENTTASQSQRGLAARLGQQSHWTDQPGCNRTDVGRTDHHGLLELE